MIVPIACVVIMAVVAIMVVFMPALVFMRVIVLFLGCAKAFGIADHVQRCAGQV